MTTTLYLAGPMSGIVDDEGRPTLNFPLFNSEAARLRALGYTVVNPAELNGGASELEECANMTPADLKAHWRKCMKRDIPAMMECDAIALLPNWFRSKGAKLEVRIASDFDVPIGMAADLIDRVPAQANSEPCSQDEWAAGRSATKTCQRCGLFGPCTGLAGGAA